MGKKKSVRKFFAEPPRLSKKVNALLDQLDALDASSQHSFVWALRDGLVISHPCVKRLLDDDDTTQRRTEDALQRSNANRPKKRGNPDRDAIILRLASEGFSDTQIGRHLDVIAANNGKRMIRVAVQSVRRRWRIKKG